MAQVLFYPVTDAAFDTASYDFVMLNALRETNAALAAIAQATAYLRDALHTSD